RTDDGRRPAHRRPRLHLADDGRARGGRAAGRPRMRGPVPSPSITGYLDARRAPPPRRRAVVTVAITSSASCQREASVDSGWCNGFGSPRNLPEELMSPMATPDSPYTPRPGTFLAALGLHLDRVVPSGLGTVVRGHVDVDERHHTPWGLVHGGVWATVIESAASVG